MSQGRESDASDATTQLFRRRAKEAEALLAERYPQAGVALMRLRTLLNSPGGDPFAVLGIEIGRVGNEPLVSLGLLGADGAKALRILAAHWEDFE